MPIKISKSLILKLPETEKSDIQTWLWHKSGGRCFLCGEILNESNDAIVADHDIPEHDNGPTNRDNLNLVHQACNSFKQAHKTVNVRPYLTLTQKIVKAGFSVK